MTQRICICFLIVLTTCCVSYSQYSYSDARYSFVIELDTSLGDDQSSVKSIRVFNKTDGQEIQTIIPKETWLMGNFEQELFFVEDVNFDGYNDIRILNQTPFYYQNITYYYYLFDPQLHLFVEDSILATAWLTSPTFDPGNKTITTFWSEGSSLYGQNKYRFENNVLTLEWQTSSEVLEESFITEVSEPVNDSLTVVERIERTKLPGKVNRVQYRQYKLIEGSLTLVKQKNYRGSIYDE